MEIFSGSTNQSNNLNIIAQLVDRDKSTELTLPNGKSNPDTLENRLGSFVSGLYGFDIKTNDNLKKPKYQYLGTYQPAFIQAIESEEDRKKVNEDYLAIKNEILDEYGKMCERHADDPDFQAVKDMLDFNLILEDPDRCIYPQAYSENPYIEPLFVQGGAMPNFSKSSFKEIVDTFSKPSDPENGVLESPLDMLSKFYKSIENLYDREGEKQKMRRNGYTPENEKEYLQRLKGNMAETVEYFDKLRDFVVLHGDEPEFQTGKYMNNEDVDYILEVVPKVVERLRAMSPVWEKMMNGQKYE